MAARLALAATLLMAACASAMEPDEVMYIWSGREPRSFVDGTQAGADFLAVANFDQRDPDYGMIVRTVDVAPPANTHNEPTDAALSADGKWLAATNFLGGVRRQGDFFVFNTTHGATPVLDHLVDVPGFACAGEVQAYKQGFLVAMACNEALDSNGTVVFYDPAARQFVNFLRDPRPDQTNEAGFSVRADKDSLLVADIGVPLTAIQTPPDGSCLVWRSTVEEYNLGGNFQYQWRVPNAGGFTTVKHIPHDPRGRGVAFGLGSGIVYVFEHGKPAVAVYDLNRLSSGPSGGQIVFTRDGTRAIITWQLRWVLLFDFSEPELPVLLDAHDFGDMAGTHTVKITKDESRVVVGNYFAEWDDLSKVIHFGGKRSVAVFILDDGTLTLDPRFMPDLHALSARPAGFAFKKLHVEVHHDDDDDDSSSSSSSSSSASGDRRQDGGHEYVWQHCRHGVRPDHHNVLKKKIHLAALQGKALLKNHILAGRCSGHGGSDDDDDDSSSDSDAWSVRELRGQQRQIDLAFAKAYQPRAYGKLPSSADYSTSRRVESSRWSDTDTAAASTN